MKDQLNSPLETAVYHIERVLNHKGIVHLQNFNSRNLNMFQLHSVDIIAILLAVIVVILAIVKTIACFISHKLKNVLLGTHNHVQLDKKRR